MIQTLRLLLLVAFAASTARAGDVFTATPVTGTGGVTVVVPGPSFGGGQGGAPAGGNLLGHGVSAGGFSGRSFQDQLNSIRVNALSKAKDVKAAAGFDPASEPGHLLSSPSKENTRVVRVEPRAGPLKTAVVKTASADIIKREVVTRRILAEFPLFQQNFETPPAAAYTAGLFGQKGVMVMEDRPAKHALELTAAQRGAFAVLMYGLGISDLNSDGVRIGQGGKVLLLDFEGALTPLRSNMTPGALTDPAAHLNRSHLNLPSDYQPAIDAWKAWLADATVRARILEHFTAAGFSGREAAAHLRTLDANAELMESLIMNDAMDANQRFYRDAARDGLTQEQARQLSDSNRRKVEGQ